MILSIIVLFLGVIGLFYAIKIKRIKSTIENSSIVSFSALKEMIGSGEADVNTKIATEIEGIISDKSYIVSPVSSTRCVYYTHVVKEKFKEKYYTYINNRKRVAWATKYDTITDTSDAVNFEVIAENGDSVMVCPSYSNIYLPKKHKTFTPKNRSVGHDIKILGEETVECSLPVGHKVYVVGEAKIVDGSLLLCKSDDKNSPMVIADTTKDKYYKQQSIIYTIMFYVSILNIVLGSALLIITIVTGK